MYKRTTFFCFSILSGNVLNEKYARCNNIIIRRGTLGELHVGLGSGVFTTCFWKGGGLGCINTIWTGLSPPKSYRAQRYYRSRVFVYGYGGLTSTVWQNYMFYSNC